ncbi:hypothetical protein I4U23_027607 [Adineta vaga]|nr:hypothetical protein I4U23_027607 [Adineta vaga]
MVERNNVIIKIILLLSILNVNNSESKSFNSIKTLLNQPSVNRSDWCRFNNGTSIPLGYVFQHSICTMCHCTISRLIRCITLQCVSRTCSDNTKPIYKSDQCCSHCKNDISTNSCQFNELSFPHGVLIKKLPGIVQCWCQSGNIQCLCQTNYNQCQNVTSSFQNLKVTISF